MKKTYGETMGYKNSIKDVDENHDLEIICVRKEVSLCLWERKHEIIGRILHMYKFDNIERFENFLIEQCLKENKEVYLDFKNQVIEIKNREVNKNVNS